MKKLFAIIYIFSFFINISTTFVLGATISYETLAPIESQGIPAEMTISPTGFSNYINLLYKIGVSAAVGLAVIMIIMGGIEYITSDALGGKEGGKEKITQALSGLLLALSSYVILNTIDKNLINTNLEIQEVKTPTNPLTGLPWKTNDRINATNPYTPGTPEYQNYQDAMNRMIAAATGEGLIEGLATNFGTADSEDNGVGSPLVGDGRGRGVITDAAIAGQLGVALPMELLRAYFNIKDNKLSSWEPVRRAAVRVSNDNGEFRYVPIVDIGPGRVPITRGVVIDETRPLNSILGGDGHRTYEIIPNYYSSAEARALSYTRAP